MHKFRTLPLKFFTSRRIVWGSMWGMERGQPHHHEHPQRQTGPECVRKDSEARVSGWRRTFPAGLARCPKSWMFRAQVDGKRRDVGLGAADVDGLSHEASGADDTRYSDIPLMLRRDLSLAEAREKAAALRKLAKGESDPKVDRDRQAAALYRRVRGRRGWQGSPAGSSPHGSRLGSGLSARRP